MSAPNGRHPEEAPPSYPFQDGHPPVISETPVQWVVDVVNTPGGQRFALTLRVPNGSVSVLLIRDDAVRLQKQVAGKIAEMHGLIIPGGM